jgi:hypothetical protein
MLTFKLAYNKYIRKEYEKGRDGSIHRRDENCIGKGEGKAALGRPRWEVSIILDLREL